MSNELENLNLTEEDFTLLQEALEHMPSKDLAGKLMFNMIEHMVGEKTPEAIEQRKAKMISDERKEQAKKQQVVEDVRVLQGKLIQLKRYLLGQGALKQANDQ